jgi:hypothetical protein
MKYDISSNSTVASANSKLQTGKPLTGTHTKPSTSSGIMKPPSTGSGILKPQTSNSDVKPQTGGDGAGKSVRISTTLRQESDEIAGTINASEPEQQL